MSLAPALAFVASKKFVLPAGIRTLAVELMSVFLGEKAPFNKNSTTFCLSSVLCDRVLS